MDIEEAKPCPRCGGATAIIKDPVFYGRMYCTCSNPSCEWYRYCPDAFAGRNKAWAVSRWNIHRMRVMLKEDKDAET